MKEEGKMQRRTFFRWLLAGLGAAAATPLVGAGNRSILIQESPLAGFPFYAGEMILPSLSVGDELRLVREASNVHDSNAVAVYVDDEQLGYVPRVENTTVARMLDRGERLEARISELSDEDAWERVRFTVSLN
jgi:hypothetical protein